jgi:hypothetical protein
LGFESLAKCPLVVWGVTSAMYDNSLAESARPSISAASSARVADKRRDFGNVQIE